MFDVPRGYAKNTAKKFRTFKQEKGVRTKLPKERKIEYSKYALDTKGEKKQIDIFKLLAQREKKNDDFGNPFLVNQKRQIKKQPQRKKKLNQIWEMA